MFAQKGLFSPIGRTTVMATVAAVALTAVGPSLALAAPAGKGRPAIVATHNITDFSSRGRIYRRRGGGGAAAAAAAFAGIVGTGLAIAASQNAYAYDDGYGYYGGGPVYYGGGPYYGGYGGYRNSSVPYFHGHPNAGW